MAPEWRCLVKHLASIPNNYISAPSITWKTIIFALLWQIENMLDLSTPAIVCDSRYYRKADVQPLDRRHCTRPRYTGEPHIEGHHSQETEARQISKRSETQIQQNRKATIKWKHGHFTRSCLQKWQYCSGKTHLHFPPLITIWHSLLSRFVSFWEYSESPFHVLTVVAMVLIFLYWFWE